MYKNKKLYVVLAVKNSGQANVARSLVNKAKQVVWHNCKHSEQDASLLSGRERTLQEFLASTDEKQVWADCWLEQLDKHSAEHGVYDYDGYASFLELLLVAVNDGLTIEFVYVNAGQMHEADRSAFARVSPHFARCLLTKQKRDDLATLTAIDQNIAGMLELLSATLTTVTTD